MRVAVWRKLRSLGALYLQQSVCVLPARPEVLRQVRRLADRVHHQGGSARVMHIAFTDPGEATQVVAEMNAARDIEYGEVLERLPALSAEIAMERGRGRATYAEVEESEADLERFRSWLAKIATRDYFGAARKDQAHRAVDAAAQVLAEFEAQALRSEDPATPATEPAEPGSALRVVEER